MTAFIEKFEATKQADLEEQKNVEAMVVALLQHMSKDTEREHNLPDKNTVQDMREDLTFKERQMETSKTTQDRLEAELSKRNQELEKINTLDSKITVELSSLTTKMKSMRSDMVSGMGGNMGENMGERTCEQQFSVLCCHRPMVCVYVCVCVCVWWELML